MTAEKLSRFWLLATGLLILIVVTSSSIIWARHDRSQPITVSAANSMQFEGEIYIDGAVSNPGIYPLEPGDSIEDIIQACGGVSNNADLSNIRIYIPEAEETDLAQKIDINRAEIWLLQALPNIGEVRAQAIIDYREQSGPFRNIEELTKVPGISNSTFDRLKGLITISE